MANDGHFVIAYLDDYAGCHGDFASATQAFNAFKDLTKRLGLVLAERKCVSPTTTIDWLGYSINTNDMSVKIPRPKLDEVVKECGAWLVKKKAHKRSLQSLAGRLAFISNCVLPGRKFMARLLATIRHMGDKEWTTISDECHLDIRWFFTYAKESNGLALYNPVRPVVEMDCDSSLTGGGGNGGPFCYTWEYSRSHLNRFPNIHELEAVNLLVAVKTLAPRLSLPGGKLLVWTDNISSAFALETGRTRDSTLASCSREVWLLAAKFNQVIQIAHKKGESLPLADALSRAHSDTTKRRTAFAIMQREGLTLIPPVLDKYVFFTSLL